MLERMTDLACAAGDSLLGHYGRLTAADAARKGGRRRDLVSAADLEAERIILAGIPESDAVLAEESGARGADGDDRRWIVDPLDGTINFLHGIPFWCVSLALIEQARIAAAVVHAPALSLTFTAEAGDGCRLNGEPTRVSTVDLLEDAILATGFPYARDTLPDNNLENVPRVGIAAGGLRRLGSAALDLALVACGRLDGYWELHLEGWDVAAGTLLVREAGGRVTDFAGCDLDVESLFARNIVATNGRVHDAIRERLAPLRELG